MALRFVGSPSVTAEPKLRRAVRGGERLERHEYRQRMRLVGLVLVISIFMPTLVVSTSVGPGHHDAAVEHYGAAAERLRSNIQYSTFRFAQECVERRGVAVETQVDAAAVRSRYSRNLGGWTADVRRGDASSRECCL